ncbi:hypothetical protein [Brevundimonas sp. EYE_349]|uniref:hypothetical protein n=1 Tax=Brevundimonas sp. EYE_349 TaxID=2853455 RepID=UPI0020050577|nr:hypothetical protein [Brevundimonas sp. EYE_349]MCK6102906.1 hypothetical protein [Brevundimonas sp. EYE_349]
MDRVAATGIVEVTVVGALDRIGALLDLHWMTTEAGPQVRQPDFDMALIAALLKSAEAHGGVAAAARVGAAVQILREPGESGFSSSVSAVIWGEVAKHDRRPELVEGLQV